MYIDGNEHGLIVSHRTKPDRSLVFKVVFLDHINLIDVDCFEMSVEQVNLAIKKYFIWKNYHKSYLTASP